MEFCNLHGIFHRKQLGGRAWHRSRGERGASVPAAGTARPRAVRALLSSWGSAMLHLRLRVSGAGSASVTLGVEIFLSCLAFG